MRRLLSRGSSPPAPGGEGSPSGPHYEGSAFNGWTGARRAGRKSRARGVGNHTASPPEARSRQPKIAALERRKAQRPRSQEDAPCVSQERAAVEAPFRRSTPLALFGEGAKGLKAHPAPFQIIRAMTLGCLIIESVLPARRRSLSVRARESGHPGPIARKPATLGPRLRGGERKEV
jgi:hypothetical protein